MGEFSEVGDTISEFASENATVVVGTVIDESMGDAIKVTVVATGLGNIVSTQKAGNISLVEQRLPGKKNVEVNYSDLELPTVMRTPGRRVAVASGHGSESLDWLDVPTFIRNQAD